ncbi:unnamed protein product [Victoria cruziana]
MSSSSSGSTRRLGKLRSAVLTAIMAVALLFAGCLADTDAGDARVMQELASAIDPGGSALGWSSEDPCNWKHVSCSNDGRVTGLRLGGLSLGGSLPASLRNLSSLQTLELQNNNFSGPLPSLAGLGFISVVMLHDNSFTSFPSNFFSGLTSLQAVYLDHNPFAPWDIPPSLADARALVNFSANGAGVQGTIPPFVGSFSSIYSFNLAYNNLTGGLPGSLSGSSLQMFWLNNQKGPKLSGCIDVLANMTDLVQVWLHSNAFTGLLPDLTALTSLTDLNLRDNRLTGPVPNSLVSLRALKNISLSNNLLQGSVPVFHGDVGVDNDPKLNRYCLPAPGDCDQRVIVLLSIASAMAYPADLADSWLGNNPCGGWAGITCNPKGNITVINFQNRGFSGTISTDFGKISSLQRLVLSNNNLTGRIPKEIADLPSLVYLDVSNNFLSEKVPFFKQNVQLLTSGNPQLGKDDGSQSGSGSSGSDGSISGGASGGGSGGKRSAASVGVLVGSVIAGVCALGLLWLFAFFAYKSKHKGFGRVQSPNAVVIHPRHSGSDPEMLKITVAGASSANAVLNDGQSQGAAGPSDIQLVEAGNMVISIQVLRNVTNNFSEENILGRGGFGTVYRGELHDGTKIAVKRMESRVIGSKGSDEFQSEISVLTKGPLSRHLFNGKEEGMKPLDWKKRLSIALDVARGVEYLHSLAHQSFIHRDLKPSNILLGDDMRAKVADFGLVRLAPEGKYSVETRLAGTFGYLAPEYAVTGRVTTKADVFSFGVILMELVSGRRALDDTQPEESMHLVTWFRRMHLNKDAFRNAIDSSIEQNEETLSSIFIVAELACHCCAREPYQRPDMSHAVNVLSPLVEQWKPTGPDADDLYGIDLDMTLPQALKKWQAFEGTQMGEDSYSASMTSLDNTQTSIPNRPSGFADSFTSSDGR